MSSGAVQEERRNLAIVILGSFNPVIFQPAWFAAENLLPKGEAEGASVEVIHPEISIFNVDWLRLEVSRERLVFRTARESHFEPLRDLAVGTLMLLRHTPVGKCGVNHTSTFLFPSRTSFDAFGWNLVPRGPWEGVLQRPGLARLDEQGERPDGYPGYIRVRLTPILDGSHRLSFEVNDHFDLEPQADKLSTADRICAVLTSEWKAIAERARAIGAHLRRLEA